MEWYWNQPGVPHVAEFVEATKKRTGRVPTARTWFGYVSIWTCALGAEKAKSLKAVDMAKALAGASICRLNRPKRESAIYRAGQNQLIGSLFVGDAQAAARRRTIFSKSPSHQWRGCCGNGRRERLQDDLADLSGGNRGDRASAET